MTLCTLYNPIGTLLAYCFTVPVLRWVALTVLFVVTLPFANWGKLPCWLLSPCGRNMGRPGA